MITIIKPPSKDSNCKGGSPPYQIAYLKSYLSGYFQKDRIAVEDLEIKVWSYNLTHSKSQRINLSYFKPENIITHFFKKQDNLINIYSAKIINLTNIRSHIVVFHVNYPDELLLALPLAKLLKDKGKKIILTGVFFKKIGKRLIKNYAFIDIIIYESYGESLRLLLQDVANKKNYNMLWKEGGSIKETESLEKKIDLDSIPPPCFDGFPLKIYKEYNKLYFGINKLILPYRITEGCPNRCFFCAIPKYNYLVKNIEKVVSDLTLLSEKYNTELFFFFDNSFLVSNAYIKNLCNRLISRKLNLKFVGFALYGQLDRKSINLLKRAGCQALCFGIESLSLNLPKNKNIKHLPVILKCCEENNIWNHLFFIIGFPHQKTKDMLKDLAFIVKYKQYMNSVLVNKFQLELDANAYNEPKRFGIESVEYDWAPYKKPIPYQPSMESVKSIWANICAEELRKNKIMSFEPDKCLQFLFNNKLRQKINDYINHNKSFELSKTETFLETCRNALKNIR